MPSTATPPRTVAHGGKRLPSLDLDSYNVELKDDEGFLGDRASKEAFQEAIERWRAALRQLGADPLGEEASDELSNKAIDDLLNLGNPEAAGVIQGAIEDFSQNLSGVIRRFLKLRDWKDTERIAIGGGFRARRVGELVIGRTAAILEANKVDVEVVPIRHDPDEAALIGAVHLTPAWMFNAFDAILGVDIGGTNIRAGVVRLNRETARDLSKAKVCKFALWRYGDEEGVKRQDAVESLAEMLNGLISAATSKEVALAPFIGIGCPGIIAADGSIERGAQNLPGNWESSKFNLPCCLVSLVERIGGEEPSIVMHNDAVMQGLSQLPYMKDVERWAILTIGTGLGNARFTNRSRSEFEDG